LYFHIEQLKVELGWLKKQGLTLMEERAWIEPVIPVHRRINMDKN